MFKMFVNCVFTPREKELFDEAYRLALTFEGRPFESYEAFQPVWDKGYELSPQMDPQQRFVLAREATGRKPRLWTACKPSREHVRRNK